MTSKYADEIIGKVDQKEGMSKENLVYWLRRTDGKISLGTASDAFEEALQSGEIEFRDDRSPIEKRLNINTKKGYYPVK